MTDSQTGQLYSGWTGQRLKELLDARQDSEMIYHISIRSLVCGGIPVPQARAAGYHLGVLIGAKDLDPGLCPRPRLPCQEQTRC